VASYLSAGPVLQIRFDHWLGAVQKTMC